MFKLMRIFLPALFLFWIGLTHTAYAYIDPGAGSMMFQILIAFIVGALFTIKLWLTKVKMMVRRMFKKNKNAE